MAHSWAFSYYSNIMEMILGEREREGKRERETERRPEEKEKTHKSRVRN